MKSLALQSGSDKDIDPKVNQVEVETLIKIVNMTPSTNYDF